MTREERYKQVRDYAYGKRDLDEYKKLFSQDEKATYFKIDWSGKVIARIRKKYRQVVKNYKMVSRLKTPIAYY